MQASHGGQAGGKDAFSAALKTGFAWGEGKITYLGEQTRPILTIAFSTPGAPERRSLDHFAGFQAQQQRYGNDRLSSYGKFTVSPAMLKRIVETAGRFSDAGARQFLSVTAIVSSQTGLEGREFLISEEKAEAFYQAVMKEFQELKEPTPERLISQFHSVCS